MRLCTLVTTATALLAMTIGSRAGVSPRAPTPHEPAGSQRVTTIPFPLHFEQNVGQSDPAVAFVARCGGYTAFLSAGEAVFGAASRGGDYVRMRFQGASVHATASGVDPTGGHSHHYRGDDPREWVTDAAHFERVACSDLYPGIDLVWQPSPDRALLRYDFIVAPRADPARIAIAFDEATSIETDRGGDLIVGTPTGEFRHTRPVAYQDVDGERRTVAVRFVTDGTGCVRFQTGSYDARHALVIDPVVLFTASVGGTPNPTIRQGGFDIAVDGDGNAIVAGWTDASNFPTNSAHQGTYGGNWDGFVFKLNSAGTALLYSTFLGGSGKDHLWGVAVDDDGAAYATGQTLSSNFPTKSAYDTSLGSGVDAVVSKLDAKGKLVYSTYLGGNSTDAAWSIDVDGNDAAYVIGRTKSTDFPTTSGVLGAKAGGFGDAFVTKLDSSGSKLSYSTYFGGSRLDEGWGIQVDDKGAAHVFGMTTSNSDFPLKGALQAKFGGGFSDAFVAKINATATALVYSTYLGGSGDDAPYSQGTLQEVHGIGIDDKGAAYVTARTTSKNFPTKNPLQTSFGGGDTDAYVAKVNPTGTALDYSTYLGGSSTSNVENSRGIVVTGSGVAYVAGATTSNDFPVLNAVKATRGVSGCFLTSITTAGKLSYSTFLDGNAANGVAFHKGSVYVVNGDSSKHPKAGNVFGSGGARVTKIGPPTAPGAPANLRVTSSSDVRIELAWDAEPTSTAYDLERAVDGGAFQLLAQPAGTATAHLDTAVAGDMTYTYRLRGRNSAGNGEWSDEVTAVTISSPDQLLAEAKSNTRVDLMWRDRSGSEDGFGIERKAAGAADFVQIDSVGSNVTSFADTGVEPEKSYEYRVRATKGAGVSGWSTVARVTTPPANPADVIPESQSDTEVRLRWKDLSEAEAGYEIERGVSCPPARFQPLITVGEDVTEFVDRAADPETTYSYRVRAVGPHGASEYTPTVCVTTPPRAPTGITGEPLSPSRVLVRWKDMSQIEQGQELMRALASDGAFSPIANLGPDVEEFEDGTANQETAYVYQVAAFDGNGRSGWAKTEGVVTSAILVIRKATLTGVPGKKRSKGPKLFATGEFDTGALGISLRGVATLGVGGGEVLIPGFDIKGKGLRYQADGIRMDLKPAKGSSRVTFKLQLQGDLAAALDPDGDLAMTFESGPFEAMGTIALSRGRFAPTKGVGQWIDPAMHLLSLKAGARPGPKDSLKIKATFDASGGPPDEPTDVTVHLRFFQFTAKSAGFTRNKSGDKDTFSQKAVGTRKVIVDWKKGLVSITLKRVELGEFEAGDVPARVAIEFADVRFLDVPVLSSNGKSLKY